MTIYSRLSSIKIIINTVTIAQIIIFTNGNVENRSDGPNAREEFRSNEDDTNITAVDDRHHFVNDVITEVGSSFFYDLVAINDVYVDKSLFVRDFLNNADKVILITRPSKWGKSVNMDMLKRFLAVHPSETANNNNNNNNNNITNNNNNDNYKLFAGGEIVLDSGRTKILPPLKIAVYDDAMKHQGRYPVVSISFKNIEGKKYEEIENGLRKRIRLLYLDHGYLDDDDLPDGERLLLKKYLSGDVDAEDLKTSLLYLCRLLNRRHGKKTFVFVDEYDTPIRNVYVKMKEQTKRPNKVTATKIFRQTYVLFRALINECMNDNVYLNKGFLTGIVRLETAVTGFGNIGVYDILDEKFNPYYGFDRDEVNHLINRTSLLYNDDNNNNNNNNNNSKIDTSLEIQRWYRGFNYGKRILYNPWSIVQCLKSGTVFKPYWIESDEASTVLIEKKLIKHTYRQDVRKIMTGQINTMTIGRQFDFQILHTREGLFNALLFLGYLNPISRNGNRCKVTMPNEEIRIWYEKQVA